MLWGPWGMGKSTLALKVAAGQVERGGGLRLLFVLSASSRTPRIWSTRCWARAPGVRRGTPLRRCVGGFTSCCCLRRGAGHGWRSSRPVRPGRRRAGEGRARVADGQVAVGGQSSRRGRPNGCSRGRALGKSQSEMRERDRSVTLRLVRRGLAHDAKVRRVPAGLLLLDRLSKGRAEQTQSRVCVRPSATWKT